MCCCYLFFSDTRGCNVGQSLCRSCDQTCHENSALIASCNYPNQYEANTNCIYTIITEKGTFVSLTFMDFDVPSHDDCQTDAVRVLDQQLGFDDDELRELIFCNSMHPSGHIIRSRFNVMQISFITSAFAEKGRGFLAKYQAMFFDTSKNASLGKLC